MSELNLPLDPKERQKFTKGKEKVDIIPFQDILENIPAAIYLTDEEGRLTHFNKAAVDFSGHVPELGTDRWCVTWKLYHPDGTFMPHDTCPMAIALKEGRCIRNVEAIAERPDGRRIWFRPYPSPLRDHTGQIIGGINMLIDITEEKNAEKQLRQNELELNDFFENATVGLHWVGPTGAVLRVNQAELDLLGYTREEYVGCHISDFHADKEVIDDILKRLKAGEELHGYEARLRCKDGSIRHVSINSNVYSVDGKFIHTRCLTRDITERKKAEQALRQNEERLASKVTDMKRLYELSTQLLEQNNVEAALQKVMKASTELMNADKASVQIYDKKKNVLRLVDTIGFDQPFVDQFRVQDADGFTTSAATLRNHEQVLVEDFSNAADFSEFGQIATSYGLNAVLSTPLFGGDGSFFGVFSMYWNKPHRPVKDKLQLLDLYTQQATRQLERQQAEEALQLTNETLEERVKERTAALMSYQEQLKSLSSELSKADESARQHLATELHDNLGQLLAMSKMKLDRILKYRLPDSVHTDAVEMADLMNSAITFTRELMSDLKPPPSLEKESLAVNIAWVADKMKKHNLEVILEEDDQPKSLTEELRRTLSQCVRELLFNVIKHAGVNKAQVTLSRVNEQIQVTVEDEGKGFKLKEKRPSPTQNGGFGLFNIHERMDWLGGRMEIASKPGKGTKINLFVPLTVDEPGEIATTTIEGTDVTSPGSNGSAKRDIRIKVLLVDNHQMVRTGLRNLIEEQEDLRVIAEATNGREAVEQAHATDPDVIIMDVNMPEMDGIEATQIISSKHPNTRIIGLTLHDKEDVKKAMRRAGAVAYLSKTEAFESLSAVIRSEAVVTTNTDTAD